MNYAIFKSTGAIIIYIILSAGILAIVGYNFWGWFGGSDFWKSRHISDIPGAESGNHRSNNSETLRSSHSNSNENSVSTSRTSSPSNQRINCKQTKTINGKLYTIWGAGIQDDSKYGGNTTYYAVWANTANFSEPTIHTPITKEEYDDLHKKCFSGMVQYPSISNHTCNTEFKVGPDAITYKFSGVKHGIPNGIGDYAEWQAVYTAIGTIPSPAHPAYPIYKNPYSYSISKQQYDSLKNCFQTA